MTTQDGRHLYHHQASEGHHCPRSLVQKDIDYSLEFITVNTEALNFVDSDGFAGLLIHPPSLHPVSRSTSPSITNAADYDDTQRPSTGLMRNQPNQDSRWSVEAVMRSRGPCVDRTSSWRHQA
jgi:hypothetical protein